MYVMYSSRMTTENSILTTHASGSYAVLRHGGSPPESAQAQLGLAPARALRLERLFQARKGGGDDPMKPQFAHHAAHVAAVLRDGGYPALPERPR